MSSTGRGVTSLVPLPFAPSPEPFDLRAAKTLRTSAESAPGLTPIRLVSQLFARPTPLGQRPWLGSAPPQRTIYSMAPWAAPRANPLPRAVPVAWGVLDVPALQDPRH